jgi:hypothetical protein
VAKPKQDVPSDAPYGTQLGRSVWPLIVFIVAFVLWFGLLAWMAMRYPAR